MNLLLEDLNPDSYPSHPTNIYICGVTTTPRMCGDFLALPYNSKPMQYQDSCLHAFIILFLLCIFLFLMHLMYENDASSLRFKHVFWLGDMFISFVC